MNGELKRCSCLFVQCKLQLQPNQYSLKRIHTYPHTHTHGISLTHRHSSLNWPDPLCEPEHDCFSLLSSIVAFKYANQYLQLTLANHSLFIPQGVWFQCVTSGDTRASKNAGLLCWRAQIHPAWSPTHRSSVVWDDVENTALCWY